jgi:DUF2946 family protein
MSAWHNLSRRGSIGRQTAVRRFGAWLAMLALLAQTLTMLAPMPAAAGAPDWPAGSLCLGSGPSPASGLPASDGKHAATLHDCQACLTHHVATALVPPVANGLARVTAHGDLIVAPSDASIPHRHDPSTARPRAPPVG